MLQGVSALMGSYGSGHDTVAGVNALAQVDGLVGRVVVVGQMTGRTSNLHIIDAVVVEHLTSHVGACHTIACRYLRVFLELVLQVHLHQPAHNGYADKYNPLHSYYHNLLFSIILII